MGWKSTVTLTKEDALNKLNELFENDLGKLDNETLEDILEVVYGDKLGYNFHIGSQEDSDYTEGLLHLE